MSCATAALNDWPGWLILEPTDSSRRTVITVPAGTVSEVRAAASALLDFLFVPELLPDIVPPLLSEVSAGALFPGLAWLLSLGGCVGLLQAIKIQDKKIPSVRLTTRDRILCPPDRTINRKARTLAISNDYKCLRFVRYSSFNRQGTLRWFRGGRAVGRDGFDRHISALYRCFR